MQVFHQVACIMKLHALVRPSDIRLLPDYRHVIDYHMLASTVKSYRTLTTMGKVVAMLLKGFVHELYDCIDP